MSELIPLPDTLVPFLDPYLPRTPNGTSLFVTLTYAQSLDGMIAGAKGQQTAISHLETKTMTHYLRSKHDGILVGVGTAETDDPGLNCRYKAREGTTSTPRPIIVDPQFRWSVHEGSRVVETAAKDNGLGPWIVTVRGNRLKHAHKTAIVEKVGGKVIELDGTASLAWIDIFDSLARHGLGSVMVEGGAGVINSLLMQNTQQPDLVDSLIVTLGPVYLGDKGVHVSPASRVGVSDVTWWTGIQDSVLAGRL